MNEELESKFNDDHSFSNISNEDILKINYLTEDMSVSSLRSSNRPLKKQENKFGNMQNMANNLMQSQNNQFYGNTPDQFTMVEFKEYLKNLSQYMREYTPDLLHVFQHMNGEYDEDSGRKTPLQFSQCHAICKLNFPGLIYQLSPNTIKHEGGVIEITDYILSKSYELHCDDYPGPLTLEKTTEDQIYSYLKDQMSIELQDTSPIDWDSGHLLINYLELMIKENGKPRIGNIVRLLNDGVEMKTADLKKDSKLYDSPSRNSFSRASSRATSRASTRPSSPNNLDSIDLDLPQNSLDTPQGPGSVSSIVRRAVVNASHDQKLCQNMDRYRQYIVTGRFEEAVHFATKSGIWDHAFALALRMNNTQLINEVLVSFSRRAIYSNDPLFTMHELMAMKSPKIVAINRGFSNNEMGDWRCHLGMILAVRKFRAEECRQAIESMGEKLSALRSYFAAHLCYLLAGTPFGLEKSSPRYRRKYDLIGWQSSTSSIPAQKSNFANCHKLFTGLRYWSSAPEQCIKLTEVYEYALKLALDNGHAILSVHLLPYKYMMVYKMLAKHQVKNAYEYCVNIGEILGYNINWLDCESINFRIISNIRDLSYRLNSWLTAKEDSSFSSSNIEWLSNIDSVYCQFVDKYKLWNPNSPKPDFIERKNPDEEITYVQSQQGDIGISESGINNYYEESVSSSAYIDQNNSLVSERAGNNKTMPSKNKIYENNVHNLNMSQQSFKYDQTETIGQQNATSRQFEPMNSINGSQSFKSFHQQPPSSISRQPDYPLQTSQNPTNSQIRTVQNSYIPKSKLENPSIRDIAPPSELPNEAIMTEPPRHIDIRTHTSSSILDRNSLHNTMYDSQNVRLDSSNKMSLSKDPIMFNKSLNLMNDSYKSFSTTPQYPIRNEIPIGNVNANIPTDSDSNFRNLQHGSNFDINNFSNKPSSKGKPFSFVPSMDNVDGEEESTVDCFTNYSLNNRSRSQSNGSVGSIENPNKSSGYPVLSRSRNSSESRESTVLSYPHSTSRGLEPTREETDMTHSVDSDKIKQDQTETKAPKSGWSIFSLLQSSKPKEVHLPDDNEKSMVFDKTKNKWVDKSNPESEKPLTPPPVLPAFNSSPPPSSYQGTGPTQFVQSRYKPATMNVKPSATVASVPPNPTFTMPPHNFDGNLTRPPPTQNSYNYSAMDSNVNQQLNPNQSTHGYNDQFQQYMSNSQMNYHQMTESNQRQF